MGVFGEPGLGVGIVQSLGGSGCGVTVRYQGSSKSDWLFTIA